MLEKDEFEKWIEASHTMGEVLEGRYDVYPLAKKWVQEWFSSEQFTVNEEDVKIINSLFGNFNYATYRNFKDPIERNDDTWTKIVNKADQQFRILIENNLKPARYENIGFAVAPFLFTWNFQRFKEYLKKRNDFSIKQYFESLGEFLSNEKEMFKGFINKKLASDHIAKENIERTFNEVNSKLKEIGIKNNEPVGTIKLIHIFAPYFFPLIDNDIAKTIGLIPPKGESITLYSYIKWMNALKGWLQHYLDVIEKLEKKYNSSILKLVDEGLYLMITVNQRRRVAKLEIRVR